MKFLRYTIPFLLLLPGLTSSAQLNFSASPIEGCDSLEVTFTLNNPPPPVVITSISWDFGNGKTEATEGPHTVMYDTAGKYVVNVLVNNSISLSPKTISVFPTPRAGFWWSDSLELGSYTVAMVNWPQLVDSIPYTREWYVEKVLAGDTRGIIHTFPTAGDYIAELIVTNEIGCTDTAGRMITVEDVLDCPNVFTPNDDTYNDYWIVSTNGITVYNLQIFSQTGILVYRAEAPLLIWDGRNLSGQKLLPGTYFYIIRPADGDGSFEKKGFVEMYR